MNDGSITENDASNEPQTASVRVNPAFSIALKPTYVAEFMPIGPGVIWLTATISVNSEFDIPN